MSISKLKIISVQVVVIQWKKNYVQKKMWIMANGWHCQYSKFFDLSTVSQKSGPPKDSFMPRLRWPTTPKLIDWLIHSFVHVLPWAQGKVIQFISQKSQNIHELGPHMGPFFWLSPMFVYIYLLSQTAAKWPKKDHFGKIFSPPQFPLKILENIHGGGTIVYPQHMDRFCCHLFISTHKP